MTDVELEDLKLSVFSKDWNERNAAYETLRELNRPEILEEIFQKALYHLTFDNSRNIERDNAGYLLRYIADERALEPLLDAALKKENIRYNGSLVYSLEVFNCAYKFNELFEILLYHGGEAKLSAYIILCEQDFSFNHKDLLAIKDKWEDLLAHPEKSPEFEDLKLKAMIQDRVEAFLCYLDEPEL